LQQQLLLELAIAGSLASAHVSDIYQQQTLLGALVIG